MSRITVYMPIIREQKVVRLTFVIIRMDEEFRNTEPMGDIKYVTTNGFEIISSGSPDISNYYQHTLYVRGWENTEDMMRSRIVYTIANILELYKVRREILSALEEWSNKYSWSTNQLHLPIREVAPDTYEV
jgi:hypothetical protein